MIFKQRKLPKKNYVVQKSNRTRLMRAILSGERSDLDKWWFPLYGEPVALEGAIVMRVNEVIGFQIDF